MTTIRRDENGQWTDVLIATPLRDVSEENGARGVQVLYRLEPPLRYQVWSPATGDMVEADEPLHYVVASSVDAYSGYETLLFPADETGAVTSFGEVGGGRGIDADQALKELGYTVAL